jgi:hypothetical protein
MCCIIISLKIKYRFALVLFTYCSLYCRHWVFMYNAHGYQSSKFKWPLQMPHFTNIEDTTITLPFEDKVANTRTTSCHTENPWSYPSTAIARWGFRCSGLLFQVTELLPPALSKKRSALMFKGWEVPLFISKRQKSITPSISVTNLRTWILNRVLVGAPEGKWTLERSRSRRQYYITDLGKIIWNL